MEVLILLLAIVILFLILVSHNRVGGVERKVDHLRADFREVLHEVKNLRFLPPPPAQSPPVSLVGVNETEPVPFPVGDLVHPDRATEPGETAEPVAARLPFADEPEPHAVYGGAAPPPLPDRPSAVAAKAETGRFESSVREILAKLWNWIVVGE
jgi:hypothetical protein